MLTPAESGFPCYSYSSNAAEANQTHLTISKNFIPAEAGRLATHTRFDPVAFPIQLISVCLKGRRKLFKL